MIKVRGLPVNITKSDLDELFSPYGTIQITEISVIIKIKQSESFAELELDKNEELAIQKLNKTKWRDKYILYLNSIRGSGILEHQDEEGGNQNQAGGDRVKKGKPGGGGNQNQASGNPK
jgi:RNA recognition motif-containing protein